MMKDLENTEGTGEATDKDKKKSHAKSTETRPIAGGGTPVDQTPKGNSFMEMYQDNENTINFTLLVTALLLTVLFMWRTFASRADHIAGRDGETQRHAESRVHGRNRNRLGTVYNRKRAA